MSINRKSITFTLLLLALLQVPASALASTPISHPDNAKIRVRVFTDTNGNGVKDGSETFDNDPFTHVWVCVVQGGVEYCKNHDEQGDSFDDGVVTFTQLEEDVSITIGRCVIPGYPDNMKLGASCVSTTVQATYTTAPNPGETKTINWAFSGSF